MLSEIGILLVSASALFSVFLIFLSIKEMKEKNIFLSEKIRIFSLIQLISTNLSFVVLSIGYIFSDFSLVNVYENSHTTKPLLYKISGVWGNHEGSLLLWINILVIFSFLFLITNRKTNKKFQLFTLIFQNILVFGFLIFLITTSNPFSKIYPVPNEGLGLNPILQDPALAIHPPLLYLGFVGSSIYFSMALASLISKFRGKNFASVVKPWILISWFFQTLGILVGSIWAYYELGWGGYWFWDPVENSSLMPWFLMTALLHSILVLEKKDSLYLWVIALSILTFTMSVTGTFLVRSGILNSVHTFANDPSRGLFILVFLSLMIFLSLYVFYKFSPKEKTDKFELFSKEFFILTNNWFMTFFLITVLIGTIYPIFLEIIANENISVGPPYYIAILAPFVIPLLFFMSYAPQANWNVSKSTKTRRFLTILFLSVALIFIFIYFTNEKNILINLILLSSIYLILQTFLDLTNNIGKKNFSLYSSIFSHLGFGLLILFISLNSIFSVDHDLNIKIGEKKKIGNFEITLDDLHIYKKSNYKTYVGNVTVRNKKNNSLEFMKPEIRIYDQPETITYEASIKSNILADTYVTMSNISRSEFYNIKLQKKPFMNLIWFSTLLIAFGVVIRMLEKRKR